MDRVLNEAKAEPPANKPDSAPTPPTPPPAPVGKAPTVQDRARRRSQALSKIDRLVASADWLAGIRLKQSGLTDEERLCLRRLRAIITYGANRHYQAEEQIVEQSLQHCLMLEDQHLQAAMTASRSSATDTRPAMDGFSATSAARAVAIFSNWHANPKGEGERAGYWSAESRQTTSVQDRHWVHNLRSSEAQALTIALRSAFRRSRMRS